MATPCNTCQQPATIVLDGTPLCVRCLEYGEEYDRRLEEVQRAGITWNTSRDDPWWSVWLTSVELYSRYRLIGTQYGTAIHEVGGGIVYDYERGNSHWVQIWIAEGEVIVAYPSFTERFGFPIEEEGLFEFEKWIEHLRYSPPLIWGQVRERSSYGARWCEKQKRPIVKWAQCGDWAALARFWDLHSIEIGRAF